MIRETLDFFRREKLYAALFVAVVAAYSFFWVQTRNRAPEREPSGQVESFRKAEMNLQEKMRDNGSVADYLKGHPKLQRMLEVFSLAVFAAFGLGLAIDVLLLVRPGLRRSFERPRDERTLWKFSMLFKVVLLFMTANMLLGILLGLLRPLGVPVEGNFYMLFHTTIVDLLCVAFIFWVLRREGDWRDLGLRVPEGRLGREVLIGWAAYAAILPVFGAVLVALIALAQMLHYEPPPHPLVNVFLEEQERSPLLILYSLFLATFFGPIIEEIFFRGFCYPILKRRFGMTFAMILTSAFFASIHANTFAFWPIFVLGMGLVYVYEKRASLVAPVVLHITHNLVFIAYFFAAKDVVQKVGGPGLRLF